jgi:predicted nucleic acid-binding protein
MRVSNQWVVDASVALKWYFRDEELQSQADSLLEAFASGAATLTAPSFIRYEIANAFVVAQRRGRLSYQQLLPRLESFLALNIVQLTDDEELILAAIELTTRVPVAFYDALYLAIAQRLAFNFVTADRQLHERTKNELPWVAWLGNLETVP